MYAGLKNDMAGLREYARQQRAGILFSSENSLKKQEDSYMERFCQALTGGAKNDALPEEFDFFGKLIGSWDIDYVDNGTSQVLKSKTIHRPYKH